MAPRDFAEPERAAAAFARLREAGVPPAVLDALAARVCESADPDGALGGAERVVLAALARRLKPSWSEPEMDAVVRLAAASRFLPSVLAARPRLLASIARSPFLDRPRPAARMAADLDAHVARLEPADVEGLKRALRRFKQREVSRIALRDLRGAPLLEVTGELSQLAACAFDAAARFLDRHLRARHGDPDLPDPRPGAGFCVLGMGKLGAGELNFSSDVDVVYVYARDGKTSGGRTHFEHFARLAEEVTRAVAQPGVDGFVFRVDLNLRPEGRSGPIVNSAAAMLTYYEAFGRTWERGALIKARPIAGDLTVGDMLLNTLEPFVWRKYLDLGAVEEMREMKARIDRRAGHDPEDLKLGRGGIREIEFFVQAHQLLHGGRDPRLRERATLRALDQMLYAGLVPARDRDALADAYVFLRRLEHRVQMVGERQTHALPPPGDRRERELLARRAGLAGAAEMEALLDKHRGAVAGAFGDLLASARGDPPPADPDAETALDLVGAASREEREAALARMGFLEPEHALGELERLQRRPFSPFAGGASAAALGAVPPLPEHAGLGERLLREAARAPDPDRALRTLADFLTRLASPRTTFDVLARSPATARLLLTLFGASEVLGSYFARHPELVDRLVRTGAPAPRRPPAELDAEIAERLGRHASVEARLGALRRFKNEETLRIALGDLSGALEVEDVLSELTALAEACLAAALELSAPGVPLCAVGMGSLGAREMTYGADLDLLFLYDGIEHEPATRAAQRIISNLTLTLREGVLYKIDTRLRPSGSQGPLVVSLARFRAYHTEGGEAGPTAALWERFALLRFRPVAGELALGARARAEVVDRALFERPLPPRAAEETRTLRARIVRESDAAARGRADPKLSRGGLAELESAVHFLQLAHRVAEVSTPAAIDKLRSAGALDDDAADALRAAWRFLRRLELRLRMVRGRDEPLPASPAALRRLATGLGYAGAEAAAALQRDFAAHTDRVHAVAERVLGARP